MIAPMRSLGASLLCLLGALPLLACSGASSTSAAATSTSTDQAHVASSINEPRTQDPTAAAPLPVSTAGSVPAVKPPAGKPAKAPPAPSTNEDSAASSPPAEVSPPSKIGARHVLVQWMGADRAGKSVLRMREQALVLIQEVQRRAKAGEDLGRLAVEYSDEPNAGDRRGSLGRFGRGQMVPAFDSAAFKLKVGEISDIVETPFGFHIIQRTE